MYARKRIHIPGIPPSVGWVGVFAALYAFALCMAYVWLDWTFLAVSAEPITLVGIATVGLLGFRYQAAQQRLREGRRVWSQLVNASRSWGMLVMDYVGSFNSPSCGLSGELCTTQQLLIYRHIAYLNALRLQLYCRSTESPNVATDQPPTDERAKLDKALSLFLHDEEVEFFITRQNPAAQIVRQQSRQLHDLRRAGQLSECYHCALENILTDLYDQQSMAECLQSRSFEGPYAFVRTVFIGLLPLGLLSAMSQAVWLTIPLFTFIALVIYALEHATGAAANPFGSGVNAIPMTKLCRNVEIDLREMLGETELTRRIKPIGSVHS